MINVVAILFYELFLDKVVDRSAVPLDFNRVNER